MEQGAGVALEGAATLTIPAVRPVRVAAVRSVTRAPRAASLSETGTSTRVTAPGAACGGVELGRTATTGTP